MVVGNQVPRYSGWKLYLGEILASNPITLETKYRDIADGNPEGLVGVTSAKIAVGNQVPRYSGWKPPYCHAVTTKNNVGNQVPRYSGWKLNFVCFPAIDVLRLETKYRDIADGNKSGLMTRSIACATLETKYRDIADGNWSLPP